MAPASPVRMVDTQESLFVDDTPPQAKSTDAATAADDGMRSTAACDIVRDSGDSCSDNEELQQTVLKMDTGADDTQPEVTAQLTASNVGKVSAATVSSEPMSPSQVSSVADVLATGSDTSSKTTSTDTVADMLHNVTDHTQHDLMDQTQISTSAADYTQQNVMDQTQISTSDTSQQIDHTQTCSLDHTQDNVMDHTQASTSDPPRSCRRSGRRTRRSSWLQDTTADVDFGPARGRDLVERGRRKSDDGGDPSKVSSEKVHDSEMKTTSNVVNCDAVGKDAVLLPDVEKGRCDDDLEKVIGAEDVSSSVEKPDDEVMDHTQESTLDPTQHAVNHIQDSMVDHTQANSLDLTQRTANHSQETVTNNTQDGCVDETQSAVLGGTEAGSDDSAMATDEEDDIPLSQVSQSHDANKFLSSDDDVPLTQLKKSTAIDDAGTKRSASVTSSISSQRDHSDKTVAGHTRSRPRKDPVHTALQGRISRHVVGTRLTRINLRTRSVRRVTDNLVNVGAKRANRSQFTAVNTKQSVSTKRETSEVEEEVPSRSLRHRSGKRTLRSSLMRAVAAELDIGPAREKDLVDTGCQKSDDDGDLSKANSKKIDDSDLKITPNVVNCDDTVNEIVELQPDSEKGRSDDDPAKVIRVEELSSGVEKLDDDEDQGEGGLNADVEPTAAVEVLPPQSSGKPEVLPPESCGKPELPPPESPGKPEALPLESCGKPEVLTLDSSGEPESEINLCEETVNGDKVVEPSTERSSEEQCSSGPSNADMVTEDIAADTDFRINTPLSEFTTDEPPVTASVPNSADDAGATDVEMESTVAGGEDNKVSETQVESEKSTPTSDGGDKCQWKIPTSSVTRSQAATPADAPPETPTSIPRLRFASRGSLMLERAKQLRQSATSPPTKSSVKSSAVEQSSEDETTDQSPGSAVGCRSSGLSRLRVFSPAASPSAGILRKRQLSTDSATGSGQSPSSPSSRVSCLCLLFRFRFFAAYIAV